MSGPASRILTNVTLDWWRRPHEPRHAIAIRGERVLACGQWREIRELAGPRTSIIDGGGHAAVPALHDAHLHLLSWARSRRKVDCSGVGSLRDLQRKLAASATGKPTSAWICAVGFSEEGTEEGRLPRREELDAAVSDHPVRVQHRSMHVDMLNTKALSQLGLLASRDHGVERDPITASATGRVYDLGEFLGRMTPASDRQELESDLRAASRQLLAWGVTSVHGQATLTLRR